MYLACSSFRTICNNGFSSSLNKTATPQKKSRLLLLLPVASLSSPSLLSPLLPSSRARPPSLCPSRAPPPPPSFASVCLCVCVCIRVCVCVCVSECVCFFLLCVLSSLLSLVFFFFPSPSFSSLFFFLLCFFSFLFLFPFLLIFLGLFSFLSHHLLSLFSLCALGFSHSSLSSLVCACECV